jgi:toluene monooxygenase system ferredoxin subunit
MSAQDTERWVEATTSDDVWENEMTPVTVSGIDLILMRVAGTVVAYEDKCPHSGSALSNGFFEGGVLTCASHLWEFDAASGLGINPKDCRLSGFPANEADGIIYVRLER